ncbi:hypothetical protein [Hyphomicrobium sp. DY-1]|uniref:hypothetical protein n=1 Tax=Hyphomicrobium sp. DY-1 TaxID=3075650 RepID=UPI0039C2D623
MTYRRGVVYKTDGRGRVTVAYSPEWNGKPCIDQFPPDVRVAIAAEPMLLDIGDAKKLVAARDHGKDMVVAVIDDLRCARAVRRLLAADYSDREKAAATAAFPDYAGEAPSRDNAPADINPGIAYAQSQPFEPYEDEINAIQPCHGCGSVWCRCGLPLEADTSSEEEDEHRM